jgi:hypothetical protein
MQLKSLQLLGGDLTYRAFRRHLLSCEPCCSLGYTDVVHCPGGLAVPWSHVK